MAEAVSEKKDEKARPKKGKFSAATLVFLLNTVLGLGAAGLLYYTKFVFKREVITEESERERLAKEKKLTDRNLLIASLSFEPVTVNIEATPSQARTMDGVHYPGKLHYLTVGFVLEISDATRKNEVENLRPVIMDKLLSIVARKKIHELTNVQGRYLLRNQLIDSLNQLVLKVLGSGRAGGGAESESAYYSTLSQQGLVSNIYFTQFVAQ